MNTKRLWIALALIMAASFTVLGFLGTEIHRQAPPMPAAVVDTTGAVIYTRDDIQNGQLAWESMGGQEVGSIWGHGAYVAPDWSADQLHRESVALLDIWARREHAGQSFAQLSPAEQAPLRARLVPEMRTNTYSSATNQIVVSVDRAEAMREVKAHYVALLSDDPKFEKLREQYAIADNPLPDAERRAQVAAYYFWTGWATATNRPGAEISYTSNWPHEPLVNNEPSPANLIWSVASVLFLIIGVAVLTWIHARMKHETPLAAPASDPLSGFKPTASMRATYKYFLTVIGLFLLQIGLGAVTAHYAVEGHDFYGIPISRWLPYAVTRTWHTQLAVFWIATAWLATGLYIAPLVSGKEPKYQALGVNILWVALVIVVLGSMTGEWLGVQQVFDLSSNWWFGHQGWEYIDLGRFWQTLLFVGLMLWLVLVTRALMPALRAPSESKPVLAILFLSTIAIGAFYGAGFMWGQHTHVSMVEYWRWWVVHLWVEGFFEVFATAVISFLFVKFGLVRAQTANVAVVFGTIVFMFGGVLGTAHHWYFAGTPLSVIAVGAMFSALEVVPLALIGGEALETYRHTKAAPWVAAYKWPIMFFVAVAFWNLIGAGVFGFLINPPISLYYIQGLNTTANHGHAALFGVYGMLGIGLMLFCLRGLAPRHGWNDGLLKTAFWSLNIGLAMMTLLSLLPSGVLQAFYSIKDGMWMARSPEVIHSPLMQMFVWMRVPGDIVFSVGAVCIAVFAAGLVFTRRAAHAKDEAVAVPAE